MIPEPAALAYLAVPLKCFVFSCVYMFVYVQREVQGGAQGTTQNAGSLPQWLSTLIFWGRVFLLTSKQASVGRLAGRQVSKDLPVTATQTWDSRHILVSQFLLRVLEICSWVFVLQQQALQCLSHLSRPVSHLPPAACKSSWKPSSASLDFPPPSPTRGAKEHGEMNRSRCENSKVFFRVQRLHSREDGLPCTNLWALWKCAMSIHTTM